MKHPHTLLASALTFAAALSLSGCPFQVESGSAGSNFGPSPNDESEFVVSGSDPADALDFVFTVEGDLVLTDITAPLLSVADLEVVRGDLIIRDNPDLSSLTFRRLSLVTGEIRIEDNPQLQNVTLNALDAADGPLFVDDNPRLSFVRTDSLRTLGGLSINSPEMNDLIFPTLETVGGDVFIGAVAFAGNTSTSEVRFDALTLVEGDFLVVNNAQLRFAVAPQLQRTEGAFVIEDNPRLATLDFPSLRRADGGVCLCGNQNLDSCAAVALAEQIQSSETVVVEDNQGECVD